MPVCCPMPRVLLCLVILVAMIHGASNVIRADASEAATADPAATDSKPTPNGGLGAGCGASGVPARKVVRVYPQPSLRHATPRYEVAFAVSPGDAAIISLLEKPLPEGGLIELNESPLRDLHTWIGNTYKVPVQVDSRALEDAGLDIDHCIMTHQAGGTGTLGAALIGVLEQHGLAVIVQHEALWLTTAERADELLVVGVYPLPTDVLPPRVASLIEAIQSTIAPETWELVGGQGAIRRLAGANELVVSQTLDVHMDIIAFMRAAFDTDLMAGPDRVEGQVPMRIHVLRDAPTAKELAMSIAALCNAALGTAADPEAKITLFGNDRLIVQSASRPFHIYAAELIRSLDGIEVPGDFDDTHPAMRGGFCWVARAVYGEHNPRWLIFRAWLIDDAPEWLRRVYNTHGEAFAAWLHDRPVAKAALRPLMDAVVGDR